MVNGRPDGKQAVACALCGQTATKAETAAVVKAEATDVERGEWDDTYGAHNEEPMC